MRDQTNDQSGRWSPAECDTDQEMGNSLRPPVGYTGGKWKPGHGPVDVYSGYRILDSSLEERTTAAAEVVDPVTEKIRRICLSLRSGVFDRKSLLLEERKCLQEFPFLCRVCPFFSTQMSSFTWHLNSSHHNERAPHVEMKCQICCFSCHRIEDLIQHFNLERKKGKTGTRRSKNLIESQFMRGTIFSCETPSTKFSCSLCDRRFRLRVAHRIHFRTHHHSQPKSGTTRCQAVGQSVPEDGVAAEGAEDQLICPMCSSRHSTKGKVPPIQTVSLAAISHPLIPSLVSQGTCVNT